MKLKDMVELLSNNDACVVLKVKDGQEMNLISLGCFNGDEVMMRLTKGRDVTCTLFRKNGKCQCSDDGRTNGRVSEIASSEIRATPSLSTRELEAETEMPGMGRRNCIKTRTSSRRGMTNTIAPTDTTSSVFRRSGSRTLTRLSADRGEIFQTTTRLYCMISSRSWRRRYSIRMCKRRVRHEEHLFAGRTIWFWEIQRRP